MLENLMALFTCITLSVKIDKKGNVLICKSLLTSIYSTSFCKKMLKFYSCCANSVSKNNNCTHHRMKSMLETLNELFNENCNGLHSNNLHFHTPPDINVKTLNAVFTIPCTSLEFRKKDV